MLNRTRQCLILGVFGLAVTARAATYTGSLTYTPPFPPDAADELSVQVDGLDWVTYTLSISWTVTDTDHTYPTHPWKYSYTFQHDGNQAAISHLIIEGSEGIQEDDIIGLSGAKNLDVGLQQAQSGNPDIPEGLWGIRVEPTGSDVKSLTFSFYSNRVPVWGDFYAKNGGHAGMFNSAFNYNNTAGVESGFLSPDVDPAFPAASGTVANHYYYHILRPDSVVVPEPATIALLGAAMLLPMARRRGIKHSGH